jgi:hypothetical protein
LRIEYVSYQDIQRSKWDACIQTAANGMIYAESVYLDNLCEHWDGLVLNDYEAVMPLPWKKKWGIRYLYQPAFMQQCGVFGKAPVTANILNQFIEEARKHFKFAEITLNHGNDTSLAGQDIQLQSRNNFILAMGNGFPSIYKNYSPYIRKRLSRAGKFSLQYKPGLNFSAAIEHYKQLYLERLPSFHEEDFVHFEKLCSAYTNESRIIIREVYRKDGSDLLAMVLLLKDDKRLYNIISCLWPNGRKCLANYFLYNELIREFAKEKLVLDFEGSDVPGIAFFYKKFSSANQPYPFIKFNDLPAAIRILKP